MNNSSYESNDCGRCGTHFDGVVCPECGLVMCSNIISDTNEKSFLVSMAISFLKEQNIIMSEENIDDSIVSFYYVIKSKDDSEDVSAAFKIITSVREFYFNYVNGRLQFLKPEGKSMYENEFSNVRRIHKINDYDTNKSAYEMSIKSLNIIEMFRCKNCQAIISPYDIICKKCHRHIVDDFPEYYRDMELIVSFGSGVSYHIMFVIPDNLKVNGDGSNGYFSLLDEDKSSLVSFRFYETKVFSKVIDKSIGPIKSKKCLGKNLETTYIKFEDGVVIFSGEVKFSDNLYGVMEYEVMNAKSVDVYDEQELEKWLMVLCYVHITGNGYEEKNGGNTNVPMSEEDNEMRNTNGSALLILVIIAIIGIVIFFMTR